MKLVLIVKYDGVNYIVFIKTTFCEKQLYLEQA